MDILFKSIAAAAVTALILILERYSGPRIAGAIGGIPIVFAISFVLVTMGSKDPTQISQFLQGGIIGAIGGTLFCLLLLFLNSKFGEYYWVNFIGTYAATFFFALFAAQMLNKA